MNAGSKFWQMKDTVLQEELKKRRIPLTTYNRKEAIALLRMDEEKQIVTLSPEDEVESIEEITHKAPKEEQAKLELVKVVFHAADENALPYVPVGHNGRAYYIPVDMEVDVPKYILDSCIKDAVEEKMMPIKDLATGGIKWVYRKIQRYPYTVVR